MRATAVARVASAAASPVYQVTVLAAVPATKAVALENGGPATRRGGLAASTLKKSSAAATAHAAVSEVSASLPTAVCSAAFRLAAVTTVLGSMVNWFAPGVVELVAVSVMLSLDPSGSVKA